MPTTIEKFHLGYSEDFLGVIKFLNKKGFDDKILTDLNIFKKKTLIIKYMICIQRE